MTAAHTGSSASCHCINLINKYNTGRISFGVGKQIPHPRGTYTHKHFHKIRTGDAEKRHPRLPCNRLGDQGLAGSRRSHQKHAFGNPCSHLGVAPGIAQKIHDLLQLALFFFQSGHVFKTGGFLAAVYHLGMALAKVHHPGIASAVVPAQSHDDKENHQPAQDQGHAVSLQKSRLYHRQDVIGYLGLS